jgi:hypothetical protein
MSSATAGEPHTNSNMGLTMLVIYGGRERTIDEFRTLAGTRTRHRP